MDFTISSEIEDCRARIADFVDTRILPVEADRSLWDEHGNIARPALDDLRQQARDQGLWCLQLARETGGQGLGKLGWRSVTRK